MHTPLTDLTTLDFGFAAAAEQQSQSIASGIDFPLALQDAIEAGRHWRKQTLAVLDRELPCQAIADFQATSRFPFFDF